MEFQSTLLILIAVYAANGESIMHKLKITGQNQNINQATSLKMEFPFETIISTSLEMAFQSCQSSFQWDQWNCPRTDFFIRHISRPYLLDREDSYVHGIMTAATLYSIIKSCSNGYIAGCGCRDFKSGQISSQCSDDPQQAVDLYHANFGIRFSSDFSGSAKLHNFKAVKNILKKSLIQQCGCNSNCSEDICIKILKTFAEIAADIRKMYDEGLQLTNVGGENSQVIWENVPLDSLVYMKDSPNYCEPDAGPFWNGVRGRQCQMDLQDGSDKSCASLCFSCGYQIKTREAVLEHRCNCQFTWLYQVHCDICSTVEVKFYCD